MNRYPVKIVCTTCKTPAELREVSYSANGELRFIGFCFTCRNKVSWVVESDTLHTWAKHYDSPFPSPLDHDFLHDLRVAWEPPTELIQPPQ
jgi:hypothetical protein